MIGYVNRIILLIIIGGLIVKVKERINEIEENEMSEEVNVAIQEANNL